MVPLFILGCADQHTVPTGIPPEPVIQITAALPASSRCEGGSPAIQWIGLPPETNSLALTLIEPSPQGPWVHWMAWDIPFDEGSLEDGILATRAPPTQGINSTGSVGYAAPCPAESSRYELRIFALSAPLALPPTATWAELGAAIQPRTIAWGIRTIEVSGADD